MIYFRCAEEALTPSYMTARSAGADLKARIGMVIRPGGRVKVPSGLWIERVDWDQVPQPAVPELQIRARSGLAWKHGICLPNGVGTIDADYADEICVLLWNTGSEEFGINVGDRIAQLVLNLVYQFPNLGFGGHRRGGFGSTGMS